MLDTDTEPALVRAILQALADAGYPLSERGTAGPMLDWRTADRVEVCHWDDAHSPWGATATLLRQANRAVVETYATALHSAGFTATVLTYPDGRTYVQVRPAGAGEGGPILDTREDAPILDPSVTARFWTKVQKTDECWLWQSVHSSSGYGKFKLYGKMERAHRVAWLLPYGAIPVGQHVLHRCDNPPCVRPDHLFLGTNRDNIQDRTIKGRSKNAIEAMRRVRTKLTDEQIQEIRRLYVPHTMTIAMLAEQFATTKSYISNILHGNRRQSSKTGGQ